MGKAEKILQTGTGERFEPLKFMPARLPEARKRRLIRLAAHAERRALAAIEVHCVSCCAWQRAEARACAISSCALWSFNRRIFAREPVSAEAECEVEP